MMSGIRGAHTKPELFVRSGLHRRGFRYRLHDRSLPGRPDLVFPAFGAVIFAHGCFWHGHQCALFKWPSSRVEFWRHKIGGNVERDKRALALLEEKGWRVAVVWECAIKGPGKLPPDSVLSQCESWLRSSRSHLEIRGTK
jgi:DNA mismatch endonuclease (patch repair protein)